ncbi:MAG: DUF4231 domain-containing protein [Saprospiraceae bacterium]
MTEQEYLKDRVDDQIDWLGGKSSFNQKRYKRLRVLILITSALIPLLSGFITDENWGLKVAVGIGGVIVAVSQGYISIHKYHELWVQYRATAEALKREKLLYLAKVGAYADTGKAFEHFVLTVEAILSDENKQWVENLKTLSGNQSAS